MLYLDRVADSIKKAVKQAENVLGTKIKKANISIGGIGLKFSNFNRLCNHFKSRLEITNLDVTKVISNSEDNLDIVNKKIIHTIPLSYKLDGKDIYARPEGLKGIKLEV